jgi:hypothetical protein
MNNKLMSYEEAKEQLKEVETKQRYMKGERKDDEKGDFTIRMAQIHVSMYKKEINKLLTIIHIHKQSRKLWSEKEYWKAKYIGVPCE